MKNRVSETGAKETGLLCQGEEFETIPSRSENELQFGW